MCKLLIVSGLNPKNKELNWNFIQEMGAAMSKYNTDGLGYTAVNPDGNMFGERWLINDEAFDFRKKKHTKLVDVDKILKNYKGFLSLDKEWVINDRYNSFGVINEEISAITLHTRMATSGKGFANTHPFVDEETGTSIVHNGVIHNVSKEDNIRSTCDSERILNKYIKYNVGSNPQNIQKVAEALSGYYRVGAFSLDKNGKRVLDIFQCDKSGGLDAAYVVELGAVVFTSYLSDLKDVCRSLGLTVAAEFKVANECLLRLDPVTGARLVKQEFKVKSNIVTYNHGSWNKHRGTGYYPGSSTYMDQEAIEDKRSTDVLTEKDFTSVPATEFASKVNDADKDIISEADLQARIDEMDREEEAMKDGWERMENGAWIKNKKVSQ